MGAQQNITTNLIIAKYNYKFKKVKRKNDVVAYGFKNIVIKNDSYQTT